MDAVYDWSRFNTLPQAYDWIRLTISEDPPAARELADCCIRYGNQATIRRIGYLLDTLNQSPSLLERLRSQLTSSKALIPWIGGKPGQGGVNRAWGVIVNE